MRRTNIWSALCGLVVLVLTMPSFADQTVYENGDVLIGTRAAGWELDDSQEVERPLLVVIDSPYQVYDEAGTFIHVAAWTAEGTPARGARVYLSGHLVGRTDETGTLAFRWGVPGNDVESYWLNGSAIAVRWDHDGVLYGGQVWFSAFSRTTSFASDHLFVHTDRGIYSPGQTINVRAIGWHLAADYEPLEGAQMELALHAPDGRTVTGGAGETDQFGTTALDLRVPESAEEGIYELVVSHNGAQSSARLRIERFEPPVIEIEHTLGRFLTRDQPNLAFDVNLSYFTGGEFGDGTLAIDLLVDGASQYHSDSEVVGPGPHAVEISGDVLTEIRDRLYENQLIEVRIAVTDEHGRSDDLKRELRYTANPYVVIIEKDRDYYSTGDPIELVVRLTDRDRVPVRDTEVRLTATCGDDQLGTTDSGGTVQFSLTMGESECSAEVFLADVATPLATASIPWQLPQAMRSHIADAIVQEDAPVHVSVSFPANFEPAESVVHMDVVDTSGSLVNSVLIPIRYDGTDYIAEGDFTAPSWGSMLLTLFCLGRTEGAAGEIAEGHSALGLMTEGQNLAVHPGRELQIELDGIPDEVAPGADFSGQVRVTDRDGNLVDAVVGAAVVDRSIVSLKDPLEITPMDHFYNPELRVISTTGSAILTWPVVSRNWGYRVMDVALPPFPYLEGGPVSAGGNRGFGYMEEEESEMAFEGAPAGIMPSSAPPPELMMAQDQGIGAGYMEEASAAEEAAGRARRELGATAEPVVETIITVRTEFPETALWAPQLYTEDGVVQLSGSMPDSITEQEVMLVASDRRGGVGVLRSTVRVTQRFFLRSDLPDTLTVGDRLEARVAVQNLTTLPERVQVSMSGDFEILGSQNQEVEVPAFGIAVATFEIVARQAGELDYTISANAPLWLDIEERDIWSRPSGVPTLTSFSGSLTAESAYEIEVEVPEDGQLTTTVLNVAFPAVSAAFAGLDALHAELRTDDIMSMGGELIASALLYNYQLQSGVEEAELATVRADLQAAVHELVSAQRSDGGWGFWWDEESSPYVTGYALEALITLQKIGLNVSEQAFNRSTMYLINSRNGRTYDMGAIAFWEGNTEAVRMGMTAEIFSILAAIPTSTRNAYWEGAISAMAEQFREYLDIDSPEVLTYAYAVLGLHRLNQAGVFSTDRDRLVEAAHRLNTLRREEHWEPSWFNSYGGTIEATVTALEVFQALDADLLAGDVRDAIRYLISTRDEWGGWHNPRGTAAAIRGILILQPGGAEVASTVVVTVDGEEIARVAIDPEDPYLSALALRSLDLTSVMEPGSHRVRVEYDGRLAPDVRINQSHWGDAEPMPSLVLLTAELDKNSLAMGELVDYQLRVESQSATARLIRVDVPVPANTDFDRTTVQSLRERGLVEALQWTDDGASFYLNLAGNEARDLDLRLIGTRTGEAAVPAATAMIITGPGAEPQPVSATRAASLTVE